jgi:hypothetical protein
LSRRDEPKRSGDPIRAHGPLDGIRPGLDQIELYALSANFLRSVEVVCMVGYVDQHVEPLDRRDRTPNRVNESTDGSLLFQT